MQNAPCLTTTALDFGVGEQSTQSATFSARSIP